MVSVGVDKTVVTGSREVDSASAWWVVLGRNRDDVGPEAAVTGVVAVGSAVDDVGQVLHDTGQLVAIKDPSVPSSVHNPLAASASHSDR